MQKGPWSSPRGNRSSTRSPPSPRSGFDFLEQECGQSKADAALAAALAAKHAELFAAALAKFVLEQFALAHLAKLKAKLFEEIEQGTYPGPEAVVTDTPGEVGGGGAAKLVDTIADLHMLPSLPGHPPVVWDQLSGTFAIANAVWPVITTDSKLFADMLSMAVAQLWQECADTTTFDHYDVIETAQWHAKNHGL